jgi:predicted dienelactone hydrolase
MFSPGWGAAAYYNMDVGTSLAKHGFVVAAVTHYGDNTSFNRAEPVDPLAVVLYNRPRDVSAALDAVLEMDLLSGAIDQSMIIASGWSLGGYAAMVLAAGDDLVCDLVPSGRIPPWTCAPSFPDPRIKMIIPLDGSNQLLHFQELARITLPAMGIGQEWSTVDSWQARQHAAFSGHPAYRVDVNRSIHQSFSTLCETVQVYGDYGLVSASHVASVLANYCGPDVIESAEAHRLVAKYMLAMLTHQQSILTPGHAITSEPDIEFFVTEKRNPHSIDAEWPDFFTYHMHQPGKATSRANKNLTATAETNPTDRPPVERVGIDWRW